MAKVQSAIYHKRKYPNINDWFSYIWNYNLNAKGLKTIQDASNNI